MRCRPQQCPERNHIDAPGRYIVELSPTDRRIPFLRLNVRLPRQPDRVVYLPAIQRTSYLLESTEGGLVLQFDGSDIVASSIRRLRLRDFGAVLRQRRLQKRFALPLGRGIVLRPLLHVAGQEGQRFEPCPREPSGWGFGTASANLQKTLARHFDGPPSQARNAGPPPSRDRRGAAPALPRFLARIRGAAGSDRSSVPSYPHADPARRGTAERVQARFQDAEIIVYDNRGRDVGPFIQLLREGRLDAFDLICKLHGKKSGLSGPRMLLGEIWRQATTFDLIGSRDVVDRIVAEFEHSPETQMIGSRRFRLPNEWKRRRRRGARTGRWSSMLKTMGMSASSRLDYFAGTMFWVRRGALEPLEQLGLSLASFPNETGQQDGTLQHALERVLGMICAKISGVAWDDE